MAASYNPTMILNVALLQMSACGPDIDANRAKGEAFCRQAKALGADIALFPEMWSNGYAACPADDAGRAAWRAQAVGRDGAYVAHFRALARELGMAIAITYLERWDGAPRNTVSIIDRHGEVALTYAKVHTCDFSDERELTPGDAFHVAPLDTTHGPVQVGAMICYDREFPESARVLMLQGAEIILTPNACELERHRIWQFATRAYENMVGVAMANYASPGQNGHSVAFDGVAFEGVDGEDGHAVDTLIVEAGGDEGVFIAPFDIDRLRSYRLRETWGDAYRKPRVYAAITSAEAQDPFRRPDSRRG
jgi:N-carbamoylputrescine amidase